MDDDLALNTKGGKDESAAIRRCDTCDVPHYKGRLLFFIIYDYDNTLAPIVTHCCQYQPLSVATAIAPIENAFGPLVWKLNTNIHIATSDNERQSRWRRQNVLLKSFATTTSRYCKS